MEHFYHNIDGWFDFQPVYTRIVNELSNNGHIVEVGAWKGKSTAYLAVEIINSGKNIKLDVVDNWMGGTENATYYYQDSFYKKHGSVLDLFKSNVQSVLHIINIVNNLSEEASKLYSNHSLDFVFIDADHSYEAVKKDIKAWLPKVKKFGYIGGHDYNAHLGVNRAVDEYFGKNNIEVINTSWLIKI